MSDRLKAIARRATAVAVAGVGAAAAVPAPAAHASSIGGIFLFRRNEHVLRNCPGGNHYLGSNDGNVNLNEKYIFTSKGISSTSDGNGNHHAKWEQFASSKANIEDWCYNGSFYDQYYANNTFHRYGYHVWICSSGGGCTAGAVSYGPWKSGLKTRKS